MPDPIDITFTYTREEYLRAMRTYYAKHIKLGRDLVGGFVALGLAAVFFTVIPSTFSAWVMVAIGVFLLGMVGYVHFLLPRLIYNSDPKYKQEYRLTFAADDIHFRTAGVDSHIAWTWYERWVTTPEFYFLLQGRRGITVIPRRVFASPDIDTRFAELAASKLGPTKT